ncbi:glucooligosaccharide oxidase [Coprinopsis sp. MPI-PUGE-AT-0042]|nr:glucooligosaccharide oxidase [Coprinopsis sp. MPI-PUGE-AT-0042]
MKAAGILSALVALAGVVNVGAQSALYSELKTLGFNVTIPSDSGVPIFNLRITTRPLAVAIPRNSQDVANVVRIASKHNYKVTVKSGGHAYNAGGLGGGDSIVVVDLRNFNTVQFDGSTNRATIGPGTWLINVASALIAQGRALPHGTCPTVAVGGHAAFGGYGFMSRKHGLLLDKISEVEVVLANGTIARASRDRNSDLFWALRGAAPSFGIVTSFTAETVPMPSSPTVFDYGWTLSASELSTAIDNLQKFTLGTSSPPELSGEYYISQGPRPGTNAVSALVNTVPRSYEWRDKKTAPYWDAREQVCLSLPPSDSLMNAQARDAFASYLANSAYGANTNWFVQVNPFGGPSSGVAQVPVDDTAVLMQLYSSTFNENPPFPSEGLQLLDAPTQNMWTPRLSGWERLYYGDHYPRLQLLKAKYDPQNLFSFQQSIAA